MSKVLKSDNLKANKKQDIKIVRSDEAVIKKVVVKKQTASNVVRTSKQLNGSRVVAEDKEKSKLSNVANSALNKAKVGPLKVQPERKATENPPSSYLVPRKTISTIQQKYTPLRTKQSSTLKNSKDTLLQYRTSSKINAPKLDNKPVYKKANAVLNTPHNVTVSSPPAKRKNNGKSEVVSNDEKKRNNSKLNRKGSRTLEPDEIVVLKRESAKMRSEEKIRQQNMKVENTLVTALKEPVAFEVKFEKEENTRRDRSASRGKISPLNVKNSNDEEHNYSDDFESYESDFESESSTHSLTTSNTESEDLSVESPSKKSENVKASDEIENSIKQLTTDESEDDSEVTQNPITVIHRDKERMLDSGHYEMNSRKTNDFKSSDHSVQYTQPIADSLESYSLGISEQPDSGISTYGTSIPTTCNKENCEIIYGGYKDFNTKPIINQRGSDLMSKIRFDDLSFTLLEMKPISYDIYMQTFGKLNTNQSFTQTESNLMNVEQQTEQQDTRSIWTQHPAQYDLKIIKNFDNSSIYYQNCCGELSEESQALLPECELEHSLDALKHLNNQSSKRTQQNYQKRQRKLINYENLHSFLLRSSVVLDQILGSSNANSSHKIEEDNSCNNDKVLSRISEEFYYMETNFLNTLKVLKIFSNNKYNMLITVHESLPDTDVYSSDFANLLMVWCISTCDKPLRLLTTWSQVSRVEISNDSSDIIVAALRDGSIALWDMRETHSFCSKLDGYLTHFAATQSLVPSWNSSISNTKSIMDLGACLDIKSFRSQSNNLLIQNSFPKTQFVSLHDSGIVTIWTLVETTETLFNLPQGKNNDKHKRSAKIVYTFEYSSPWARVKLTQSTIANVKDYLETKSHHTQSRFDKTKALFQKDIYSDEALKELNEFSLDVGQQGLRFISVECGTENLFICTNRNYILMCSKMLKLDKLKKIVINESKFLFPTALKVLTNEHFLAVGLSNGAVMILNCQSHRINQTNKSNESATVLDTVSSNKDLTLDINPITGKSCAIQNILLNAQKSYEEIDFERDYRPTTAACIALIESKQKPFELRIFDQQIIMSGTVLRTNLIQSLEVSSDGWHLFALANGHIRIYDFYLDQEIAYHESQETGNIIDIATAKSGCQEKNLIILEPKERVKVYILNK